MTGPYVERFAEPRDVLATFTNNPPYSNLPARTSVKVKDRYSWDLGMDWEAAVTAYRDGWAEGADRCRELARTLVVAPTRQRRKLKPAMAGHVANVPAFLAGSPVSMYATTRKTVAGGAHVSLFVQISMLADVDAEAVFARGVALVAIVDALEDAGCRCEVTGLMGRNKDRGGMPWSQATQQTYLTLKTWDQPLNLEAFMFTVTHPAMNRRIGFRLIEVCPDRTVRAMSEDNYGATCEPPTHADLGADPATTAIFGRVTSRENDRTNPADWVKVLLACLPESARTALNVD